MAIVMLQDSQQIAEETYNKVTEKMGVHDNPPEGLVVHTAGEVDGTWRIADVWESKEHYDRFLQERLGPAIAEVMKELGMDPPSGPPTDQIWETRDLIVP